MDDDARAAAGDITPPRTSSFVIAIVVVGITFALVAGGVTAALVMGGSHDDPAQRHVATTFDLASQPMSIAEHYRFAAAHPHAYAAVPCFCGCDAMLDHRNLLECFVRAAGGWERHASGCAVCIDESETVRSMLGDGASVRDIGSTVIDAYTS